ncbi:MAG: NUDIX hydrolase [Leadbetterella sp.]
MEFELFTSKLRNASKMVILDSFFDEEFIRHHAQFMKRNPDSKTRKAAVLILIFPKDQKAHTCFILRPEYEGNHGGQVSFPGGGQESTDRSLQATALREAQEEIGIKFSDVEILGQLRSIYIPISDYEVYPFLGILPFTPEYFPDPKEVQKILELDVSKMLSPSFFVKRRIVVLGKEISTYGFDLEENWVWGATGQMLANFIKFFKSID